MTRTVADVKAELEQARSWPVTPANSMRILELLAEVDKLELQGYKLKRYKRFGKTKGE